MTNRINTPWGLSDYHEQFAPGIDWYSTPSHGGVKLSPDRNNAIPLPWRIADGWYEEDIDWAIPCYFHPEGWVHQPGVFDAAIATLKNWHWEKWEQYHGIELGPEESNCKADWLYRQANKGKYMVCTAWSDHTIWVPEGMVGICAAIDGPRVYTSQAQMQEPVQEAWFLVPAIEYEACDRQPFVIDESRHQRIEKPAKDVMHRITRVEIPGA